MGVGLSAIQVSDFSNSFVYKSSFELSQFRVGWVGLVQMTSFGSLVGYESVLSGLILENFFFFLLFVIGVAASYLSNVPIFGYRIDISTHSFRVYCYFEDQWAWGFLFHIKGRTKAQVMVA